MSLNDFMKNYDRAVMDRREKENDEDFESNYSNPILKFSTNLEKDAATYYTRSLFKMFQGQLVQSISYHHRKVDESGSKSVYHVWREEHEQTVRTVTFDSSNVRVNCSCQLFEFAGCLCRHVLKIFLVENVTKLPRDYILKRWSKDAKYGSVVCVNGESMRADCQESLTVRYSTLCKEAINIATVGATSPEVYKVAIRTLNNSLKVVEAALKRVTISSNDSNKNVEANEMPESSSIRTGNRKPLLDPPIVKHIGRPKRLSWIDKKPRSNTIPKTKPSKKSKDLSSSNIPVGTSSKMRYDPAQRKKFGQGMQGVALNCENNFNQSHEKLVIDLNESIWDSSVMNM